MALHFAWIIAGLLVYYVAKKSSIVAEVEQEEDYLPTNQPQELKGALTRSDQSGTTTKGAYLD